MTPFELSVKYYPYLWSKERLQALVAIQKLTTEQYEEITGEPYIA